MRTSKNLKQHYSLAETSAKVYLRVHKAHGTVWRSSSLVPVCRSGGACCGRLHVHSHLPSWLVLGNIHHRVPWMFPSGMEKITLTFPKSDCVVNSHCTTISNRTQGWGPSAERYSACLVHAFLSSIPSTTVKCNELTGIKQQSPFTKCYQLDTSFLSVAHASFPSSEWSHKTAIPIYLRQWIFNLLKTGTGKALKTKIKNSV